MKLRLPWLHDPLLHLLAVVALVAAMATWLRGGSERSAAGAEAPHGHASTPHEACIVCRALPAELTAESDERACRAAERAPQSKL